MVLWDVGVVAGSETTGLREPPARVFPARPSRVLSGLERDGTALPVGRGHLSLARGSVLPAIL